MNICVVYQHIGYKKSPNIKNRLIVDENVADIVRKIFDMYANEYGTVEIVNYLNNNKYLSPTGYRKTGLVQYGNLSKINDFKYNNNYIWNEVTLCNMLKNEVYIGNTVQNKKTVVSYKVKKIRTVEKEKQIRVNNTHKSIIDKDVFEKVNNILKRRGTNSKFKYNYLLRGFLYCYHCKRKLQIVLKKNSKRNGRSYPYITCSNYKSRGCYPLNINYEKFEDYIIYMVKNIIQNYADREILYSFYEKYQNKILDTREDFKKRIMYLDEAIYEINNNLNVMYMDKLKGILLEEEYVAYSKKAILERKNLIKQKEELLAQSEEISNIKNKKNEIDKIIESFLKLEKIDKIYLYRLIDKIEIDKDKNIYIYFNFSKNVL